MYVGMYVCNVYMYVIVCIYVCMHACMYVDKYIYIYIYIYGCRPIPGPLWKMTLAKDPWEIHFYKTYIIITIINVTFFVVACVAQT